MTQLFTASTLGVNAHTIVVETHVDSGLYAFNIVGLPDSAVRESRERIVAAIKNSGYAVPPRRYTVNLAPADVRKEGSAFDLPIALGILAATGQIEPDGDTLRRTTVVGELALDGKIRSSRGALPIALHVAALGHRRLLLPDGNADEAGLVRDLDVIPLGSLEEAVAVIENRAGARGPIEQITVADSASFEKSCAPDLCDVKGQSNAKRALEVAAAGGHNLLMIGPPGSGKTMIARRLPGILPPLDFREAIESTKIHSVAGLLNGTGSVVKNRPFRSPHHTISTAALVGGGVGVARPGEISLAHHGVLFLDELPEFQRNALEVLRQPLEENEITISRSRLTLRFPCNFMLVASMNPCPCGNYGNSHAECHCSPVQIQRYAGKISGPLLDRIDLHIEVAAVSHDDLAGKRLSESSATVRERVVAARERQTMRFEAEEGLRKNADMPAAALRRYCELDEQTTMLMKMAMTRLGLSARAYDKVLKVARTIADLDEKNVIGPEHLSEAIQYRGLDRASRFG